MRRRAIATRTVDDAATAIRTMLAKRGYTEDRAKAAFTSVCGISRLNENEVRIKMGIPTGKPIHADTWEQVLQEANADRAKRNAEWDVERKRRLLPWNRAQAIKFKNTMLAAACSDWKVIRLNDGHYGLQYCDADETDILLTNEADYFESVWYEPEYPQY